LSVVALRSASITCNNDFSFLKSIWKESNSRVLFVLAPPLFNCFPCTLRDGLDSLQSLGRTSGWDHHNVLQRRKRSTRGRDREPIWRGNVHGLRDLVAVVLLSGRQCVEQKRVGLARPLGRNIEHGRVGVAILALRHGYEIG